MSVTVSRSPASSWVTFFLKKEKTTPTPARIGSAAPMAAPKAPRLLVALPTTEER
ncbi:hypothetical protein ACTTAL_13575 [Rhodobacter capsulatus]